MNIKAMDFQKTLVTIRSIGSDAYKGISNRLLGYAEPLMNEIDSLDIAPDQTDRDHRYEHAIDELITAKDSQKLFSLIEKVNNHNKTHESLAFHMSPIHHAKIQQPLQDLYAKKRKELIADATTQASTLIAQWELDYEVLIQTMNEKEATIRNMSGIIAAAGGQKPDDKSVTNELEKLLAIEKKYTFAATLAKLLEQQTKKGRDGFCSKAETSRSSSSSSSSSLTSKPTAALTSNANQAASSTTTTTTTHTLSTSSSPSSSNSASVTPAPAAFISDTTSPSPLNLGNGSDEDDDDDADDTSNTATTSTKKKKNKKKK
jgi:hypothetical protein